MEGNVDVVREWPELFVGLTPEQIDACRQTWASAAHEGWQPNREQVAEVVSSLREGLTTTEDLRQAARRDRHQ